MYVTVREIVRKITEDSNLFKYLPQCLVMDFIEFLQLHKKRKEVTSYLRQTYATGLDYRVFKNATLQLVTSLDLDAKEATLRMSRALNCGLSQFEQTRRSHVTYPLHDEVKSVTPPKSLVKTLRKALSREKRPWRDHPSVEIKAARLELDGVTGLLDSVIGENTDMFQFTEHPFLAHLLEALILLTMRRRTNDSVYRAGLEGRLAIFYPALQDDDNEYIPFFRVASSESYFTKRFTDRLWEDILQVRNEILALKLQLLNEELDEGVEPQDDILATYLQALEKLPEEKRERYKVNDVTLFVFDDESLRRKERNLRDQQQ